MCRRVLTDTAAIVQGKPQKNQHSPACGGSAKRLCAVCDGQQHFILFLELCCDFPGVSSTVQNQCGMEMAGQKEDICVSLRRAADNLFYEFNSENMNRCPLKSI